MICFRDIEIIKYLFPLILFWAPYRAGGTRFFVNSLRRIHKKSSNRCLHHGRDLGFKNRDLKIILCSFEACIGIKLPDKPKSNKN